MTSQVQLISPENVPSVMPIVEGMLDEALERGAMYGVDDAYEEFRAGNWQLWVTWHERGVPDGLAVTTIKQHAKLRECVIMVATGTDMQLWVHHISEIERWARDFGCDRMKATARPGWERILTDYRKTHVILHKDLHDG